MAENGDLEAMTSSDLDLTSQTETEDTDTGDLEESGTTFSSSDGSDSTFSTMSSSSTSKMPKDSHPPNMNSVSSADGSTSTGNDEPPDIGKSDQVFKYPSLPKASYDLTEVSELSDFDFSSVCYQNSHSKSLHGEENVGVRNRKRFQFPDFATMKGTWFRHPCFKRYWDHYGSVMTWCKRHYSAYNSVTKKNNPQSYDRQSRHSNQISDMLSWQQHYLNSYCFGTNQFAWKGNFNRSNSTCQKAKASKKKRRRRRKAKSRSLGHSQGDSIEEDADSGETFEMEITDEMMEFFKQSEEHRRMRDEKRTAEKDSAQQEEEHVNIEDVKVSAHKGPTTEAPKERPGAKRTSEMKLLYGKGAPMIHGMETALQMTFDRNLDVKQPKIWPNMPLKLVFG